MLRSPLCEELCACAWRGLAARAVYRLGWCLRALGAAAQVRACTCSSLEVCTAEDVVLGTRNILAAVKHWHRHGQHRLGCVDIVEIRAWACGPLGAQGDRGTAAAVPLRSWLNLWNAHAREHTHSSRRPGCAGSNLLACHSLERATVARQAACYGELISRAVVCFGLPSARPHAPDCTHALCNAELARRHAADIASERFFALQAQRSEEPCRCLPLRPTPQCAACHCTVSNKFQVGELESGEAELQAARRQRMFCRRVICRSAHEVTRTWLLDDLTQLLGDERATHVLLPFHVAAGPPDAETTMLSVRTAPLSCVMRSRQVEVGLLSIMPCTRICAA
jgi:hypothetical protein